jgi:hypothetical protein
MGDYDVFHEFLCIPKVTAYPNSKYARESVG